MSIVFRDIRFYNEVLLGQPANDPLVRAVQQRHDGRWNVGFLDGHVESLRGTRLFDLSKSDEAQRWNNDHLPHNSQWVGETPP